MIDDKGAQSKSYQTKKVGKASSYVFYKTQESTKKIVAVNK